VPIQFPFSYGSETGIVGDVDARKPGDSVDITLSDSAYLMLKEGLARSNYPQKFRHLELRIDAVLFADGTLWRKGYMFVRDPNDPTKWIRTKYFAQAKAQKVNKDATPARNGIRTAVQSSRQPCSALCVSHHSRLNVSVHRDFEVCMTQQFLNDFRILLVGVQDGAERTLE
jgi:hypothetical protein